GALQLIVSRLFASCSVPRDFRDRHSFPTRRSSDLAEYPVLLESVFDDSQVERITEDRRRANGRSLMAFMERQEAQQAATGAVGDAVEGGCRYSSGWPGAGGATGAE